MQRETWPDPEEFLEAVRRIEKDERLEQVAKNKRKFWAGDLLLEMTWKRVQTRKDARK